MNCVELEGLNIAFGEVAALDNISLAVLEGMLYGIIGPDGAGKTSLMRAICTLLPYRQGRITVLGLDATTRQKELRACIGYMPQRFSLYQDLSVRQNVMFFGRLFGVSDAEIATRMEALYRFSRLEAFESRLAGDLSGGMKQKLALSCALIHTPRLIVLDEPTFGVDPVSRVEFWRILHDLKRDGISIIVSTAYMDEAQQCDAVSLFHHGKVMATGTPAEILAGYGLRLYSLESDDPARLMEYLRAQPDIDGLQMFGNEIHLSSKSELSEARLSAWQAQCPHLLRWKAIPPSMEDVFLAMMQQ